MHKKIKQRLYQSSLLVSELLFPRRCAVCDRAAPFGRKVCPDCLQKIIYIPQPRCLKCGKQLREETEEFCHDCSRKKHLFLQGRALYDYQSMSMSLYRFKYARRKEYAAFYGEQISFYLGDVIRGWGAQALVPVPVHKSRQKQRGYNQAYCLACEIGKRLQIPVMDELLLRVRKTVPQKELDESERQNNLKKAFKIGINSVKLDTIIMIDDIYTTGSTMDACADILLKNGVKKIYFITAAIGRGL